MSSFLDIITGGSSPPFHPSRLNFSYSKHGPPNSRWRIPNGRVREANSSIVNDRTLGCYMPPSAFQAETGTGVMENSHKLFAGGSSGDALVRVAVKVASGERKRVVGLCRRVRGGEEGELGSL